MLSSGRQYLQPIFAHCKLRIMSDNTRWSLRFHVDLCMKCRKVEDNKFPQLLTTSFFYGPTIDAKNIIIDRLFDNQPFFFFYLLIEKNWPLALSTGKNYIKISENINLHWNVDWNIFILSNETLNVGILKCKIVHILCKIEVNNGKLLYIRVYTYVIFTF